MPIFFLNLCINPDIFLASWAPYADFNFGRCMVYYYIPTHLRFGPFAVGGVLGCNLILAKERKLENSVTSSLTVGFYAFLAVLALTLPIIDISWWLSLPNYAQLMYNAALRVVASAGVSYLLFCTLIPKDHPCHLSLLRWFLSLPIWAPISAVSFTSYIFHMRIMQEINFNVKVRNLLGLRVPTGMEASDVLSWYFYGYHLAVVSFIVTFPIATLAHHWIEKPCDAYVRRLLDQTKEKGH